MASAHGNDDQLDLLEKLLGDRNGPVHEFASLVLNRYHPQRQAGTIQPTDLLGMACERVLKSDWQTRVPSEKHVAFMCGVIKYTLRDYMKKKVLVKNGRGRQQVELTDNLHPQADDQIPGWSLAEIDEFMADTEDALVRLERRNNKTVEQGNPLTIGARQRGVFEGRLINVPSRTLAAKYNVTESAITADWKSACAFIRDYSPSRCG